MPVPKSALKGLPTTKIDELAADLQPDELHTDQLFILLVQVAEHYINTLMELDERHTIGDYEVTLITVVDALRENLEMNMASKEIVL